MRPRGVVLATWVSLLLAGCGGAATPPPPAAPAPATPAAAVKPLPALPKEPEPGAPLPAATYEARGRRDPFAPQTVSDGGKGLTVASVKLVGIITGRQVPLALVEAPDGIGYILKSGDVLGDGRVTEITSGTVSFLVASRPGQPATAVTLRLRTD